MTTKEMRKHIKPFLEFCKEHYLNILNSGKNSYVEGMCILAWRYDEKNNVCDTSDFVNYIQGRLRATMPKNADRAKYGGYWFSNDLAGIEPRLRFINQQLKIVKP